MADAEEVSAPAPTTPSLPSELPVVPLRETVVLPMTVAPLGVGRSISVEAINRALAGDRMVLLLLQRGEAEEPSADDLHRVGTVAIIRQMAKAPTGMRVLVEGVARARAEFLQNDRGFIRALLKRASRNGRSIQSTSPPGAAAAGAGRPGAVARHRLVPRHQDPRDEPRRSAPDRVHPGKPARYETGGQAASPRGEQPGREAGRGLDGAGARN